LKTTDLELMQFLMAIHGPERDDLFEFLGAAPRMSDDMERKVDTLNTSIRLKHLRTNQRIN